MHPNALVLDAIGPTEAVPSEELHLFLRVEEPALGEECAPSDSPAESVHGARPRSTPTAWCQRSRRAATTGAPTRRQRDPSASRTPNTRAFALGRRGAWRSCIPALDTMDRRRAPRLRVPEHDLRERRSKGRSRSRSLAYVASADDALLPVCLDASNPPHHPSVPRRRRARHAVISSPGLPIS